MVNYTDTISIVRAAGVGVLIVDETLGTGDNSEDSYDLNKGNIIASSYTLSYGTSGSNNLTALAETTHYTLDLDSGRVLLTSAGITLINGKVLYAKYIHSPKISDSFLSTFIDQIEAEVDAITGNYWNEVISNTEYFDGRQENTYPTTDEPYASDWDEPSFLELKYKSIASITSFEFLDDDGTVTETIASGSYKFDTNGTLTLLNKRFPNGTQNIKVVYTHGYTTIPKLINELAAIIGGIMVYANITGGSYDDVTRFSMGRKDVSIGEIYVNVREVVRQFEVRRETILNAVGRKNDLFVI